MARKPVRRRQVMVRQGVWVRQSSEGANLCKVPRCASAPASLEPFHRGLCAHHFVTYADGRPKCRICKKKYAVDPLLEALCEGCSAPSELTPFEAHALAKLTDGTGREKQAAALSVRRLSKSAAARKRLSKALRAAGITEEYLAKKFLDNIEAKKSVFNGEGELVAEVPDHRASIQAMDMLFKVEGRYPGKERPEPVRLEPVNVNVAVLPPEEPIRAEVPVYTIPAPAERMKEDDE